jgi:hypothetical protein
MDEDNSDADEFIQTRLENGVIVIQHLNKVVHSQNLNSYLKQILIRYLIWGWNPERQAEVLASRFKGSDLHQQETKMLFPQQPGWTEQFLLPKNSIL